MARELCHSLMSAEPGAAGRVLRHAQYLNPTACAVRAPAQRAHRWMGCRPVLIDWWRASASRRRVALGVTLTFATALTVATVGVPSLLLMAGAWSFAAIAGRWVRPLAGPASWAAGVVAEVTLLVGESAVMAVLWPHNHPQFVEVTMLCVPLLVALVLYWRLSQASRPRLSRSRSRVSGEPWLALIAIILIEAMFEAIKLHGHDFGLTWAMGGDSRNNVAFDRNLLATGGVTLHQMKSYPALVNALCALLDGAGGRANLSASALLVRDIQALVSIIILSIIAVALFFMAAVAEAYHRGEQYLERLPLYLVIPLGACGSISVGAFVLGLGLSGGFVSGFGALALTGASLVLAMRLMRDYDNVTLALLTLTLFLVVASWTFLIVVPAVGLMLGYWRGVHRVRSTAREARRPHQARLTFFVIATSAVCLTGVVAALFLNGSVLVNQLQSTGGIVGPNPRLYVGLGVVTLLSVLVAPGKQQRLVRLVPLGVFVASTVVIVWIRSYHPAGIDWSYYATKMVWLSTSALLWTPFVLLVDLLRIAHRSVATAGLRLVTSAVISIAGSSGLLWGMGHETPFPFPWTWAYVGSTIPSPLELELVMHEADIGGPFVIWQYSTPFQDEVGNFWAALMWEYNANGTIRITGKNESFVNWAASENGSLAALCLALTDDRMRVVTHNPSLVPTLKWSCPGFRPVPGQSLTR
jgi:hypothetical protein